MHNDPADRYYDRKFRGAADGFRRVLTLIPRDEHASRSLARCEQLEGKPVSPGWNGIEEWTGT